MAVMRVNPNRMELMRLKKRLAVAKRGHKLLKDKEEALIKEFFDLAKRAKILRESLEKELSGAYKNFLIARATMFPQVMEEALYVPTVKTTVSVKVESVMGVKIPKFDYRVEGNPVGYGLMDTPADLDIAIETFSKILPTMLELAMVEKAVLLLAREIERTRRRVNALEYVLIPMLEETIKYISMKLDEMERSNISRLIRIKDIIRGR